MDDPVRMSGRNQSAASDHRGLQLNMTPNGAKLIGVWMVLRNFAL
jgi:hypothetical protein